MTSACTPLALSATLSQSLIPKVCWFARANQNSRRYERIIRRVGSALISSARVHSAAFAHGSIIVYAPHLSACGTRQRRSGSRRIGPPTEKFGSIKLPIRSPADRIVKIGTLRVSTWDVATPAHAILVLLHLHPIKRTASFALQRAVDGLLAESLGGGLLIHDVTAARAGTFQFYCTAGVLGGPWIVVDHDYAPGSMTAANYRGSILDVGSLDDPCLQKSSLDLQIRTAAESLRRRVG